MEGLARTARGDDRDDDTINRVQDVSGGNAKGVEPALAHVSIADGVTRRLIPAIMNFAIDFDSESCGQASEIKAVGTDRMLTTEFEAARALAQCSPKDHFRKVAGAAFASGHPDRRGVGVEYPSTTLRAVPLPVPGRYGVVL